MRGRYFMPVTPYDVLRGAMPERRGEFRGLSDRRSIDALALALEQSGGGARQSTRSAALVYLAERVRLAGFASAFGVLGALWKIERRLALWVCVAWARSEPAPEPEAQAALDALWLLVERWFRGELTSLELRKRHRSAHKLWVARASDAALWSVETRRCVSRIDQVLRIFTASKKGVLYRGARLTETADGRRTDFESEAGARFIAIAAEHLPLLPEGIVTPQREKR